MLIQGKGYTLEEIDETLDKITKSFTKIELNKVPKVKVGIVGEIYVKYSKMANNGLEDFLADQDCEVCVPGLLGFASFKVDNRIEDYKMFGGSRVKYKFCSMLHNYLTKLEGLMVDAAEKYGFVPPHRYAHTKELVNGVIGYGSKMGEGWLLTAEMIELADTGYENIVCTKLKKLTQHRLSLKSRTKTGTQTWARGSISPARFCSKYRSVQNQRLHR